MQRSGFGPIDIFSRNSPQETEVNQEKPVRIASVPTEIRNEYFPSTSRERYLYTCLFCVTVLNPLAACSYAALSILQNTVVTGK
jgi:hypothetical protein